MGDLRTATAKDGQNNHRIQEWLATLELQTTAECDQGDKGRGHQCNTTRTMRKAFALNNDAIALG